MSDIDELSKIFCSEAHERIDELRGALNAQNPELNDERSLAQARRAAHNLKGAALTVGLRPIAGMCEVLEQEIQAVADSGTAPSAECIATWLYLVSEMQGIVVDPNIVRIQIPALSGIENLSELAQSRDGASSPAQQAAGDQSLKSTTSVAEGCRDDLAACVEQAAEIRQRLIARLRSLLAFCDDNQRANLAVESARNTALRDHAAEIRDEVEALGVVLDRLTDLLR